MKRFILLFACLLPLGLAACGSTPAAPVARAAAPSAQPASEPATAPAAQPATAATPAAPPTTYADSPPGALPGFQCQHDASVAGATGSAVTAVRAATHPGFDRFVVQFNGSVPGYNVMHRASASFVQDARGNTVTLLGSAGVLVRLEPSSSYSYSGPTDLATGFPALREARQTGNFEGVTQWGLGLAHPACMRVFSLTNPSRLVIDVQH